MSVRLQVAALIFTMVQGVLFGIGAVLVLATPLSAFAMQLLPWVVGVSAAISIPLSWIIAPRLGLRRKGAKAAGARSAAAPASRAHETPAHQT